jgi:hypothetical protein
MRNLTLQEIQSLYAGLGFKTKIRDGVTAEELEEARAESVMRDSIATAERAYALGAPERVFTAGPEAIAAYANRAGIYQALGLPVVPEQVVREVADSFRQRLGSEQAGSEDDTEEDDTGE